MLVLGRQALMVQNQTRQKHGAWFPPARLALVCCKALAWQAPLCVCAVPARLLPSPLVLVEHLVGCGGLDCALPPLQGWLNTYLPPPVSVCPVCSSNLFGVRWAFFCYWTCSTLCRVVSFLVGRRKELVSMGLGWEWGEVCFGFCFGEC